MNDTLTAQLAKLEARHQRLIDIAADGLLSRSRSKNAPNALQLEKAQVQASLVDTETELAVGAERLRNALRLATDPIRFHEGAPDTGKRA